MLQPPPSLPQRRRLLPSERVPVWRRPRHAPSLPAPPRPRRPHSRRRVPNHPHTHPTPLKRVAPSPTHTRLTAICSISHSHPSTHQLQSPQIYRHPSSLVLASPALQIVRLSHMPIYFPHHFPISSFPFLFRATSYQASLRPRRSTSHAAVPVATFSPSTSAVRATVRTLTDTAPTCPHAGNYTTTVGLHSPTAAQMRLNARFTSPTSTRTGANSSQTWLCPCTTDVRQRLRLLAGCSRRISMGTTDSRRTCAEHALFCVPDVVFIQCCELAVRYCD